MPCHSCIVDNHGMLKYDDLVVCGLFLQSFTAPITLKLKKREKYLLWRQYDCPQGYMYILHDYISIDAFMCKQLFLCKL